MRIIPTVLATTPSQFIRIFDQITPITKEIHIDIMDGKFVPSTSVPMSKWPDLKDYPNHIFEAHLMVADPIKWIPKVIEKGVQRIIAHVETLDDDDIITVATLCRHNNVQCMLAANPTTRLHRLLRFKKYIRGIMLMGVYPGHNNAPFIYNTVDRVTRVRKEHKSLFIQVDGGANTNTVRLISDAGANVFNSGSYVSLNDHPQLALQELKKQV